jgi:hypothetical protein
MPRRGCSKETLAQRLIRRRQRTTRRRQLQETTQHGAGCHTGTETKPLHRVAEGQRGSHRHGLRTRIHPHFIRGRGISPRQPTVGRIFNCHVLLRPAKNWGKATDNCGKLTTTGQTNKLFQCTKRPKNQININTNTRAKQK